MRFALVITTAILTLGLASQSTHGQARAGDAPALRTIHMVDAQTGWAILINYGSGSVLGRTTDGGNHWIDVTPVSSSGQKVNVWRITVLSSHIAWVMPSGPVGSTTTEIFGTIDGGRTWRGAAIPAPAVTAISFINPREGWLLASRGAAMMKEDVEIYRSTDGGETWIAVARAAPYGNSGLPFDGGKSSITFANSTTGWITGADVHYSLYLYVTHDSGRTWREENLPLPPRLTPHWGAGAHAPKPFTTRDVILRVDHALRNDSGEKIGMIVVFYLSKDGGRTWTYTMPARRVNDSYPSSFADMNHGWVMDGYALYMTNDGGRRWTTIHPSQLPVDVTQLAFITPQVGWAIRERAPSLHETLDGGLTWVPLPYTILRQ